MPLQIPKISYQQIRNYAERFSWIDPRTGLRTVGFNRPNDSPQVKATYRRVPFHIRFVTLEGVVEEGYCICMRVWPNNMRRLLQFCDADGKPNGNFREAFDYLIVEIDGTRFITH